MKTTYASHQGLNPRDKGLFQPYLNQEQEYRQWNNLPLKPLKLIHSPPNHLKMMNLPFQVILQLNLHSIASFTIINSSKMREKVNLSKNQAKFGFFEQTASMHSATGQVSSATSQQILEAFPLAKLHPQQLIGNIFLSRFWDILNLCIWRSFSPSKRESPKAAFVCPKRGREVIFFYGFLTFR